MMKSVWRVGFSVLSILFLQSGISGADEGKVSGYMFGDYYYLAKASGNSIGAVKGAKAEKNNGFAFRRIYFEYNTEFFRVIQSGILGDF